MGLLVFVSTWPPKWGCWYLCQHDHQNGVVGVCVNMTTKMGLLVLSRTTKLGLLGFALMTIKSGFLLFVLTGPSGQGYCLCWQDHQVRVIVCVNRTIRSGLLFVLTGPSGQGYCLCWQDHQVRVIVCVDRTIRSGLLFVLTGPSGQGYCLCWQDHQVRVIVCVEMTTEHMFYLQWQDGYISCVGQSGHHCVRRTDSDWCRDHVQHQQLILWLLHGRRQYQQHGKCSPGMFLHSHYKQSMCIRFEQHEKLSLIHLFLLVMCGCSMCVYMIACVCGCMCTTHTHVWMWAALRVLQDDLCWGTRGVNHDVLSGEKNIDLIKLQVNIWFTVHGTIQCLCWKRTGKNRNE